MDDENGDIIRDSKRMNERTSTSGERVPDGRLNDSSVVIDVRLLLIVWLKWSWVVLILAGIGAAYGVNSARKITPVYEASMVVQPSGGSEGISASQARISNALGIDVGRSGQASTFGRLEVLLGSIALAQRLQEEHGLLQEIYRGLWDDVSKQWRRPSGDEFERDQRIRRFFGLPAWSPPDVEDLARFIGGAVTIEETPESEGFYDIKVRNAKPEFALRLLKLAYFAADDMAREQDIVESERRREYIKSQLAEARLVDSRQALVGLLTAEERKAMLLSSDLPYAARIIERPFVSSRPEEPNIRLKIALPAFLFGLFGLALITFVALMRRV